MDSLRLYLFGSPRLECNGRLVEMDTRKALALLAVLAVSEVEQRREVLVTLLYPESDDQSGRAAFRRTLSTLNHALGAGVLAARRDAVGLDPAAGLRVDVLEFKSLLAGQPGDAALEQAAVLYRGDFMAGFSLRDSPDFDDWQYRQSEELRHLLSGALARLSALAADQGDLERAVQYALRRIGLDPLIEEGYRQLMEIYARSGQRSAAMLQYRECVKILEHELGVSPLEETTHLYQEILSGREQAHKRESSSELRPALASPLPRSTQLPGLPVVALLPLVGRDTESGVLRKAMQSNPPDGLFISIEGEAGIGKTRLAEEFLAAARKDGRVVIQAACYDGEEELAYSPFLAVLQKALDWNVSSGSEGQPRLAERLEQLPGEVFAEAARLLPGLARMTRQAVPAPLPVGPGAQMRFFEALRSLFVCLLGGELPGIVFIDDLQWADTATLDLLTYLVRRLSAGNFWILAAWRRQEGANSERLRLLQAEQRRTGRGLHLPLQRLNAGDIQRLAHLHLGVGEKDSLPPGLAEQLFAESEGLPFIALEYLRGLEVPSADRSVPARSAGSWKISGGVRDLLYRRLMAPSEAARQLLTAAAVIGREFDLNILQAVSGRSELEIISGIEELLAQGLLGEHASGYDFTHHKLREVAYEETSLARRRLLHQRAGEALVAASQGRAGLAAGHFMQAGQAARAAEYYRLSGEYARRVYANDEALRAFQAALAAGHPDPAGIHEACGDLYTLQGNYREALSNFQAAAAFCDPGCLSNLMHKLGEIHHRLGEWEAAEGHYQAAFDTAGKDGSPAWLAHLFSDWSLTLYRRGQLEPAHRLADQALSQAQTADDPGAIAQSLNMLGILSRAGGKLEEAGDFLKASLDAAARQDDLRMRYAVLNNLARLQQERGRITEAIALAREALALCTRMGDRHRQAAILNNLADLYHAAGLDEEAMAELKKAVTIFAEIGENSGPSQPEIWKLTEW
jgi:DNA-binding SARP family transcriptional activator/chorismate mutase